MPKREDDTYRYLHGHPPTCTCAACVAKRLREAKSDKTLRRCPSCKRKSLFWNWKTELYECLNKSCRRKFTEGELSASHTRPAPCKPYEEIQRRAQERPVGTTHQYIRQPAKQRRWPRLATIAIVLVVVTVVIGLWHNQILNFFIGGTDATTQAPAPPTTQDIVPSQPPTTHTPSTPIPTPIPLPAEEDTGNIEYVYRDGAYLVGADGHRITLVNNPDATDPTWAQLKEFLVQDDTSEHPYILGQFVCADFAEQLHNRAEAAGIRAGYVSITLPYYQPSEGYAAGHALNVFRLVETDKNCYIDSTNNLTGMTWGDSLAFIESGKPYEATPVVLVDLAQENGQWYWFGFAFGLHGLVVNDALIGEVYEQW